MTRIIERDRKQATLTVPDVTVGDGHEPVPKDNDRHRSNDEKGRCVHARRQAREENGRSAGAGAERLQQRAAARAFPRPRNASQGYRRLPGCAPSLAERRSLKAEGAGPGGRNSCDLAQTRLGGNSTSGPGMGTGSGDQGCRIDLGAATRRVYARRLASYAYLSSATHARQLAFQFLSATNSRGDRSV